MPKLIRRLWADRHGGTATEYGMIAGIIVVSIAGAFSILASKLHNAFNALSF